MNLRSKKTSNTFYLIYDGDCMLCNSTARAVRVKNAVGQLELINARSNHSLVWEVASKGYDLNEGIIVKYHDRYYYGADAINFLALVSSKNNLFNKLNAKIFKHQRLAHFFYPTFKLLRNILLYIRGVDPISMPQSHFTLLEKIFAAHLKDIPLVLQKRYASAAFINKKLIMTGNLNIYVSPFFKFISPLLNVFGILTPCAGKNIPTTVKMISKFDSSLITMHRTFYYPHRKPTVFVSHLEYVKKNVVLEHIRFGISARLYYVFNNDVITMKYGGYVIKIGQLFIRLPLAFIFGKFRASEVALNENEFYMKLVIEHFILRKLFQYDGKFKINDNA